MRGVRGSTKAHTVGKSSPLALNNLSAGSCLETKFSNGERQAALCVQHTAVFNDNRLKEREGA